MSKLKKGLTYISERTNQIRYSDKNQNEQWLQPLAIYKVAPGQSIKRGQPVSVAGKEQDTDNTVLVELTNPLKHTSSVGLAMEPGTAGSVIHIIEAGQFVVNTDYYKKAKLQESLIQDGVSLADFIKAHEYLPKFLFNKDNIGKPIFIKGGTSGELTIDPEEAYLAHNNIIQVGFIADTFENAMVENEINYEKLLDTSAAISLQFEGDSRGPIDNTQFEMVTGETIYIPENKEIAIAMGHQDSENFEFKFGFRKQLQPITEDGFIAIRKCDGKTAYLSYNSDFSPKVLGKGKSTEDSAFIEIAQTYSKEEPKIIKLQKNVDYFTKDVLDEIILKLSEALTFVDGAVFDESERYTDEDSACVRLKSKKDGGVLEVYISENYLKVFELMRVYSAGASENKGTAILADIRDADRQNVIGLYSSPRPEDGIVPKGTRIIVNHLGMKKSSESLVPGASYYLGSRGTLTTIPQDYYNSVVKIGYAETENRLFISCDQPRKYWNGTLPVGYMKPTVHGQAEYGFVVMDGVTELLYEDYKDLYDALNPSLNLQLYPSRSESHTGETVFVLPKLVYNLEWKDEASQGLEMAQVKYLKEGVYVAPPAHPFVKYEGNASATEGIVNLPTIDITKLMYFSPIGEDLRSVSDTDIDLRIFVDCRETLTSDHVWTELHPGFKHINNFDYYGFEWRVEANDKADDSKTKEYKVVFINNLTDSKNEIKAHGPMIERDPFEPPMSIDGMPIRIIVERHPLWQGQFDFHGMFDDLVSQHVLRIDAATPTDEAVSGKAVDEFIRNSVTTANLTIEKPNQEAGKLLAKVVDSKIETTVNTNNVPSLEIIGDLKFTHNLEGSDDVVLFANGTFGYYKVDNVTQRLRPLTAEETNLLKKRFNASSLIPHQYLISHENEKVADEEKRGNDKGPHGIINNGMTGNLHAVDLNNTQLGTPNANLESLSEFYNKRIPFIYTSTADEGLKGDNYKMMLPKSLVIQGGNNKANIDIDVNDLTYRLASSANNEVRFIVEKGVDKFEHIYNFINNTYSVQTPDGTPAQLVAPSTIQAKNLTSEFNNTYLSNINFSTVEDFLQQNNASGHIDEKAKDHFKDTLKQNALEALSFMPTAVFHYRSEKDEPSQVKRWFGIITERLAEAKTLLNSEADISGKIGQFKKDGTLSKDFHDELTYHFSEEEIESMKEYLNFVTNNNDTAQNVLSTVGILLEASKETQQRLLPNEASIFGEDAETIPGPRTDLTEKAPSYATNTPTHLGLNRLVKALCAEIFLDADPMSIGESGGTGPDPQRYSRLDKVCKAIYGKKSSENPGEGQEAIPLDAKASTYPEKVSPNDRSSYWNVTTKDAKVTDSFNNDNLDQFEKNKWFASETVTEQGVIDENDGKTADAKFDGLNQAINRITVKLNRLTAEIHDEDNINTSAKALDRIRTNIETLLKEVYSKDYNDGENKNPFVKDGLSRFDKLTSDLYGINIKLKDDKNLGEKNTSLSTEADYDGDSTKRTFNGKTLRGKAHQVASGASEGNTIDSFISKKPETMDEIGKWANVIDILIDIIGGTEDNIVRSNKTNYNLENLDKSRPSETILERIEKLEDALDNVTTYFNADTKILEKLNSAPVDYANNIKDINTLVAWLIPFLGIKYDSSNKSWVITANPKDPIILNGQEKGNIARNGLYGALIDLANRMTDREDDDKKLDTRIGKFYGGVNEIEESDVHSISSDLLVTQRLLYGDGAFENPSGPDTGNYNITYTPAKSNIENYTINERPSKVLETAFRSLYTLPDRYNKNDKSSTNDWIKNENPTGKDDANSTTRYLLNNNRSLKSGIVPTNTSPNDCESILTGTSRESFFDGKAPRRWNRFEAIEDQLVSLRKMAFGEVGTTDKAIQATNFINRDLGIKAENKQTNFDLNNISLNSAKDDTIIKNFADTNYVNINNIGGNKFLGIHTENPQDLSSNNTTTTAATAYNIAEIDHAMIAQLLRNTFNDERVEAEKGTDELDTDSPKDSLIVRIRKLRHEIYNSEVLPGIDKDTYLKNYDSYGIRNRLALAEKRLHDIENDDTSDDARVKKLQENLGTNAEGEWLTEGDAYNKSLKGQHDTLDALVGEFSEPKTIYLDLKKSFPDGLWGSGGGHVILSTDKECANDNILLETRNVQKFTGRKPISELATLLRTDIALGAISKHGYVESTLAKGTTDVLKITLVDKYFNKPIPQKIEDNKIYFSVIERWTPGNGRPAPIDISYAGEAPDTTVCNEIEALKKEVGPHIENVEPVEKPKTLNERVNKLEKTSSAGTAYAFDAHDALGTDYENFSTRPEPKPLTVSLRLNRIQETLYGNPESSGKGLRAEVTILNQFKDNHATYKVDKSSGQEEIKGSETSHEKLNLDVIGTDYFKGRKYNSSWKPNSKTISTRLSELEANIEKEGPDKVNNPTYPFYGKSWREGINNSYELAKDAKDIADANETTIGKKGPLNIVADSTDPEKKSHYTNKYIEFTSKESENTYNTNTGENKSVLEAVKLITEEIDGIENGSGDMSSGGIGKYDKDWDNANKVIKAANYPYIEKSLWSSISALNEGVKGNDAEIESIINEKLGDDYKATPSKGTVSQRLKDLDGGKLGTRTVKASEIGGTKDNPTISEGLSLWERFTELETAVGLEHTRDQSSEANNYLMSKVGDWNNNASHISVCTSIEKLENTTAADKLEDALKNFFKKAFGTDSVEIKAFTTESHPNYLEITVSKDGQSIVLAPEVTSNSPNSTYFEITGRQYFKLLEDNFKYSSSKSITAQYTRQPKDIPGVFILKEDQTKKQSHKFTINLNTFHLEAESTLSGIVTSYSLQKAITSENPPVKIITASVV